ncbi:MAG TPA: hypothetical protein VN495_03480 [Candidatus Paceibacterota bacterium]|nr:hypothetical protein [Candidatus Paceibacterota bacterium]
MKFGTSAARTVAFASIESGSVSLGVVRIDGDATAVLASDHAELSLEARTPEQTIVGLKQLIAELGKKVLAKPEMLGQQKHIREFFCVLFAPWTSSRINRAAESYPNATHITGTMIGLLEKKAASVSGNAPDLLQSNTVQILLNGYPTAAPIGKRAQSLEAIVQISTCNPAMRAAMLEVAPTIVPGVTPPLYAGNAALMRTAAASEIEDVLVLHVSNEGSEALVLRRGVPEKHAYLQIGARSMVQKAMPNAAPEETLATLRLIANDQCSPDACTAVQQGFASMEPDLVHTFGEFFSTTLGPERLPHKIMLTVNPDLAPWLSGFFARIDFTQCTDTSQPFEVALLPLAPAGKAAAGQAVDPDFALALTLINKETNK